MSNPITSTRHACHTAKRGMPRTPGFDLSAFFVATQADSWLHKLQGHHAAAAQPWAAPWRGRWGRRPAARAAAPRSPAQTPPPTRAAAGCAPAGSPPAPPVFLKLLGSLRITDYGLAHSFSTSLLISFVVRFFDPAQTPFSSQFALKTSTASLGTKYITGMLLSDCWMPA